MILLGALMNAIRGGQHTLFIPGFKAFQAKKNKSIVERALLQLCSGDLLNSVVYGLAVLTVTQDFWLTLLSVIAMIAGASIGWRDYIYAIYKRDIDTRRNHLGFIEKPFEGMAESVKWGVVLLSIRGAVWGVALSTPFFIFGQMNLLPIVGGLTMGVIYYLISVYFDLIDFSDQKKWAFSEWVFGSVLWGLTFLGV